MLSLLLGPSGVGKSSVIDILVEEFGWRSITSVTTRPPRMDEKHKISLSRAEYQQRLDENLLFSHVEQLGHMYGTSRAEIELAVRDDAFWVLDFSVERYRGAFSKVPHQAFVIVPETEAQLLDQLAVAGRHERIGVALNELRTHFDDSSVTKLGLERSTRLVSKPGGQRDTALAIVQVAILAAGLAL